MASTPATSPVDPDGGEPLKHFHLFPDLPPEIRIQIWEKAYRALPSIPIYRFRLKFSHTQEAAEEKLKAFLVPLEEVIYLTKELRSLRRVNTESRIEGDRFFGDGWLRFNQTEKGDTSDICHPINLPWQGVCDLFCFIGLTEDDVVCLHDADMSLVDYVFSTVQAIGLGLGRNLEAGNYDIDYFVDFLLLFPQLQHASLVGDLLMSEADLNNISDRSRCDYVLSSWYGWHGTVPEEVFGSDCEDAYIITKEDHLETLEHFTNCIHYWGGTEPERAGALLRLSYGLVFRTTECLDFLLWSDEELDENVEQGGSLHEF